MTRPVCFVCQRAWRTARLIPSARRSQSSAAATKSPSPAQILANPTWSVTSLLDASSTSSSRRPPPSTTTSTEDEITPQKLRHLLRLSALPVPTDPEAEESLLDSLRAHLRFVRDVQAVDTTGVEPLRAIRDETSQGTLNATIRLEHLQDALERETKFGHRRRPRRVRSAPSQDEASAAAEAWEPLSTAGRTAAGSFFVVQNSKTSQ